MEDIKNACVKDRLSNGGKWLGVARRWMQRNVRNGDILCWSSNELVAIPFSKLEELALEVAIAAAEEERECIKK